MNTIEEEVEVLTVALKAILNIDSTIHDHPTWGLDVAKGIARKALERIQDNDPRAGTHVTYGSRPRSVVD